MDSGAGQAKDQVPRPAAAAVNDLFFLSYTDGKAGHIKVSGRVKTGHLSSFSSQKGAVGLAAVISESSHHFPGNIWLQFAYRQVVQHEQRLGATGG